MWASDSAAVAGFGDECAAPGSGLDDDHAEVVGDDVVEVASDPRALVADRLARVCLLLPLELLGSIGELCGEPGSGSHRRSLPPTPGR